MDDGGTVDETGLLRRDAGGFFLQCDGGGILRLTLLRVPVDHVEKRVRVVGLSIGEGVVEAEGVAPA